MKYTAAHVTGEVDPEGFPATCRFEYVTDTQFSSEAFTGAAVQPCAADPGAGTSPVPVEAELEGLKPATKYHVRLAATNTGGTGHSVDPSPTFETNVVGPPTVTLEEPTAVGTTSVHLSGHINPNAPAGNPAAFDVVWQFRCTPACPGVEGSIAADAQEHLVEGTAQGLEPGTAYVVRLVATNAGGEVPAGPRTFTTAGLAPVIEGPATIAASETEAVLSAKINPGGESTTYHIDYGTTIGYGASTPESPPIAEDNSLHLATTALGGLEPDTTYHWRVVANNLVGISDGPDRTFTTFAPSSALVTDCPNQAFRVGFSAYLPNCRAYEQATPVNKNGGAASGKPGLVQASASGNRITFKSPSGLPTTGGSSNLVVYVASRGASSWSSNGTLPAVAPSVGAVLLGWGDELSSFASYSPSEFFLEDTASGVFQPIHENNRESEPALDDFASDPAHFIFENRGILAPGAVAEKPNLYDMNHGNLTFEGLIPLAPATSCAGEACIPAPEGSFGGPYNWVQSDTSRGGYHSGQFSYYTQNTISDDGSKVFFTAGGTGQLYVRENAASTTEVSASKAPTADPNGPKPAAFLAATSDGSQVFFLSCAKLTEKATAVSTPGETCEGPGQTQDLYSFNTVSRELSDLTIDESDPLGANVQGMLGASADGSYVYYVADGVLTGSEENSNGEHAEPGTCEVGSNSGTCNVYLRHGSVTTFVSRLNEHNGDFNDWTPLVINGNLKEARVAASGTLLFASTEALTSYGTETANPSGECEQGVGRYCRELYIYQPGTNRIECASCDPTNASPLASAQLQTEAYGNTLSGLPLTTVLTRNISSDGSRVFFDSPDPLVAADTNGVVDAYEWEAAGTASCQSPTADGGCLYLISTGKSPHPSYLADISASGDDAFFLTQSSLVPADTDEAADIYDARVGGGLQSQYPASPQASCLAEACRGTSSSPPSDSSPGTSSFNGPGNVVAKPCKKQNGKCAKHRKHHKKTHKRRRRKTHKHNRGKSMPKHHRSSGRAAGNKRGDSK